MKTYDERTTERLYLTSDKRVVVPEGDVRARFLLNIEGPVSRAKAQEIRALANGEQYLAPIDPDKVPADEQAAPKAPAAPAAKHPNHAAPGDGPDFIVDWGNKYKGKRLGDLEDKYLTSLTKGNNPPERKALAQAELDRRTTAPPAPAAPEAPEAPEAPQAPEAPLNYGPEDVPNIGIHQGIAVKDLPLEFVTSLANGVDEAHKDWATVEVKRRDDLA